MPSHQLRFTTTSIAGLPTAAPGQRDVYRDSAVPGLELRVTASGARSFCVRQRIRQGSVERVTIGSFGGATGLTVDQARAKAKSILGVQAEGNSFGRKDLNERRFAKTLSDALTDYVNDNSARKRPLKERTKTDYLEMVRPAGRPEDGKRHAAGELASFAGRKLSSIEGHQIKALHQKIAQRSTTRAAYAMRVLRAVLNYEGIRLAIDPFAAATAKRDRIVLPAARKRTRIINRAELPAWWTAAAATRTGDAFQFMVLTGIRHGELKKILVEHIDLERRTLQLFDTKNRQDHTVYLSTQARSLVARRVDGKCQGDLLWDRADDPRKSLARIVRVSGVAFSAHDCRRTFATTAGAMLPGYVVKKLINHLPGSDVTGDYLNFEEQTLRDAWQQVADVLSPIA